jgi:hypothetical protein
MKRVVASWSKVVVVILAALVCTVGFGAGVAFAQNPHFIKVTETLLSNGDIQVKFKEAGLGDTTTTYDLSGTATITCTCVNHSGSCPKAANKQTLSVGADTEVSIDPKNGTVSATIILEAPECPSGAPPTCGNGQDFVLSAISWSDLSFEDATNNVDAGVAATAGPVTFFSCP